MERYLKIFCVLVVIILFSSACSFFGKTADKDDWYGIMGPGSFDRHRANTIALDEQQFFLDQNQRAVKEGSSHQDSRNLNVSPGLPAYNFILANLTPRRGRTKLESYVARVYKIIPPPSGDRSSWDNPIIIGLRYSTSLFSGDRVVPDLPAGYYQVQWLKGGRVVRKDPLTLIPLHKVEIPALLMEGLDLKKKTIKNFSYIE